MLTSVKLFLNDESRCREMHDLILNRIKESRLPLSYSAYTDMADQILIAMKIKVQSSDRCEMTDSLWKMFLEGKFRGEPNG